MASAATTAESDDVGVAEAAAEAAERAPDADDDAETANFKFTITR